MAAESKDFNEQHPERKDDEIFLTNASLKDFNSLDLYETKRTGTVAYDIDGKPLGDRWPGSFPVFVKKDEYFSRNPSAKEDLKV